jgi:shikimate kinase
VALGGGALGTRSVREALAGHRVVLLDVSLAQALDRVAGDDSRPMLRNPDLPALYAGREQAYRDAAQAVIPVDGLTPEQVATHVLEVLARLGVGE